MRISGFILVIDSYLLRKGLVSVINRIQGARVLKEFTTGDPFLVYLENKTVDYIIISQAGFEHLSDQFIAKPGLLDKTILFREAEGARSSRLSRDQEEQASISLSDNKETIIKKINGLLHLREELLTESSSSTLSPRETTIVRLVSMGLTNREIAEKLFLSTHTVMTHRKNINNKLGIKSVSGLTVYAIVNNIITIEDLSSKP